MLEQREGQRELRAVERALGLPDHDGVEASVGGAQEPEEPAGLRSALPGKGARLSDVEELGNDLPARRFDELRSTAELPRARGRRLLLVLGRDASVEREALHDS